MKWLGIFLLLPASACFISEDPEDTLPVDAAPRLDAVPAGHAGVLINEIAAGEDYIELFNPGADVDLTGWALVDGGFIEADATTHVGHRLVLAGTIAFGSRLLLPDLPFRMGGADVVRLLDATGAEVDRVQWNEGEGEPARCRLPDGAGAFGPCGQSPGEANIGRPVPSTRGVSLVINEVAASGDDPIELHNPGAEPVDLTGFSLADEAALASDRFPLVGRMAPGAYRAILKDEHLLGLATGDTLYLLDPEGAAIDSTTWGDGAAFVSWCRVPDGTGPFQSCSALTLYLPNTP